MGEGSFYNQFLAIITNYCYKQYYFGYDYDSKSYKKGYQTKYLKVIATSTLVIQTIMCANGLLKVQVYTIINK